jgi:ribosomal protein L11 methyltransferase
MKHNNDFNHREPKKWTKLTVEVSSALSDNVAAFLGNLTGGGIEYNNCFTPESDNQTDSLSAYLINDSEINQNLKTVHSFLDNLANQHPLQNIPALKTELIVEEDWGSSWKKHFKPLQATRRLIIKPSWETYKPTEDQLVIEMDPGMAFGTGMHASTQLALELIDQLYLPSEPGPSSTLDVGTGTGILGMSCALLGSQKTVAIDNDIDARAAARNNIINNKLTHKMIVVDQDLTELTETFELVIANIIYNTLIELAQPLIARLAQKGFLIMAGILNGPQIDDIIATYCKLGMAVTEVKQKDEWSSVCMRRT